MGGRGANTVLQITYLNSVVMPDEASSSSSEEDDENDDRSSGSDDFDDRVFPSTHTTQSHDHISISP